MDGIGFLLIVLAVLVVLTIFGLNIYSFFIAPGRSRVEGFEKQDASEFKSSDEKPNPKEPQVSPISTQIRAALTPLDIQEICPLYDQIRETSLKNEMAGPNPPTQQEAKKRIEADLAVKIPGGALPCPLLHWPKDSATDLEWLDWLQKIPKDFGARVVFMAIYAKEFLTKQQTDLQDALEGKKTPGTEGFADICTPDLAATRRAEAAKRQSESAAQACVLPEDLDPKQIQESVTTLLKELTATKIKILTDKGIDPEIDILPLIKEASKSAEYLKKQGSAAESGTLSMSAPAPGL